jgi:hypothetical protein
VFQIKLVNQRYQSPKIKIENKEKAAELNPSDDQVKGHAKKLKLLVKDYSQ